MERQPLTRERILDAAEELLRRYGPMKTTVVDVAKALGTSHANVYRHVASKADLQDAVAERWLHRLLEPLTAIAEGDGPAPARLEAWLRGLVAAKRRKIADDPELFATYHQVVSQARGVVEAHLAEMRRQVARIVADGIAQNTFRAADPDAAAAAVLQATVLFHHPQHLLEGRTDPQALDGVLALLLAGLGVNARDQ